LKVEKEKEEHRAKGKEEDKGEDEEARKEHRIGDKKAGKTSTKQQGTKRKATNQNPERGEATLPSEGLKQSEKNAGEILEEPKKTNQVFAAKPTGSFIKRFGFANDNKQEGVPRDEE
jgi:hypothetical protein